MIKKFKLFNEELNPETYISAADKLKEMGHTSRSSRIRNHISRLPETIFNVWVFDALWGGQLNQSYKLTKLNKTPIKAKITSVYFQDDYFKDIIGEYEEFKLKHIQPLSLSFVITPLNPDDIKSLKRDRKHLYNVMDDGRIELFQLMPDINTENKSCDILSSGNISTMDESICKFADRESAVKFKKFMSDILFNKVKYYSYYKDKHTDEIITISDAIRDHFIDGLDFELSEVHNVYKKMCNINTNLLYTE